MAVYTWGLGQSGQLGIGLTETKHVPQLVKKVDDGKKLKIVQQIGCGALFTSKSFLKCQKKNYLEKLKLVIL